MAKSHLIALPAQELAVLLRVANAPQYAALFAQLPALRAALQSPIDDLLLKLAHVTREAIGYVASNTNYPEDWDADRQLANRLITQKLAQFEAQRAALSVSVADGSDDVVTEGDLL
jgi:hypothetical protein